MAAGKRLREASLRRRPCPQPRGGPLGTRSAFDRAFPLRRADGRGLALFGRVSGVAALGVASVVLVAGTGCGERVEPTDELRLYPVLVEAGGAGSLRLRRPARRIVVLSRGPLDILRRLDLGSRVVLAPTAAARARGAFDRSGRLVTASLRGLHADLVLASSADPRTEVVRAGRAARAPVYVAPGSAIADVERGIADIGLLSGRVLAARRLVLAIEARRRAVAGRLAGRPRVAVFVDRGFRTTVSTRSLAGRLLTEAGGRNVAGASAGVEPFEAARLAHLDPLVYIATSDSGASLGLLRRNRLTRRLAAVRRGRFTVVPAALLEPGPRVGEAVERLARLLHPDAFR